jgi:hypothetical protein
LAISWLNINLTDGIVVRHGFGGNQGLPQIMSGLLSTLLKNVQIHVLEEDARLILCSQIACMLDKYLIKRYVVSLIFTQYVLCENARLVLTMTFFGSSKMVSRFLESKHDTYCKKFLLWLFAKNNLNGQ